MELSWKYITHTCCKQNSTMHNLSTKFRLQVVLIFSTLVLLSSCGVVKALRALINKKVKPQYYTYEDKSIIFTPLTHFGQKEFYANLTDFLVQWKRKGYTVFYEGIQHKASDMGVDSLTADIAMRKWRKILGGEGATREDYAELRRCSKRGLPNRRIKIWVLTIRILMQI